MVARWCFFMPLPTASRPSTRAAGSPKRSIARPCEPCSIRGVSPPIGWTSLAATCPTDDFDEVEESIRAGLTITVVDGDPDAFLVDLPRDGQLVEAIISTRRADPR